MISIGVYIHPQAEVSPKASVGYGTRIWRQVQVREHATIGEYCNLGMGVYVDTRVKIGSKVKIQNYVALFEGVTLEDGVFVGPHVCFTNDLFPRAILPDGTLKGEADWRTTRTVVKYGAALGAGAVIRCGVTIGSFALVGAGAVVTGDVLPYALVVGNPARQHGYVCRCGRPLAHFHEESGGLIGVCVVCGEFTIPLLLRGG